MARAHAQRASLALCVTNRLPNAANALPEASATETLDSAFVEVFRVSNKVLLQLVGPEDRPVVVVVELAWVDLVDLLEAVLVVQAERLEEELEVPVEMDPVVAEEWADMVVVVVRRPSTCILLATSPMETGTLH
jgi:hypothetical protein